MPNGNCPAWPSDAVMIVASNAGDELRENMEGPFPCQCRDCGAHLVADTKTVRFAREHFAGFQLAIRFFCVGCCVQYDRDTLTHFHDHRKGENVEKNLATQARESA